ncbi:MAG: tetratricopeptide repeat protein, partial [Candidatus Eisenbacteria bacterium]|nr:tetratricopeptide repeat protein [Candidatus Eisenbacteria bacterium]
MSLFTKLFGLGENDQYNAGIEHYNRGEYDLAVDKFEAVIATITDKSDPYYQLGLFYAAETHAHLGFAFYKQGDLDGAEAQFARAVGENTRYPDLHYHLGVIYEKKGLHDKAITSLTRAVEINPEYMEAYCQLAIALSEAGRSDEAAKAFEKATRFGLSLPMPDSMHLSEICERFLRPPYDELMGATLAREEFRVLINDSIIAHNEGRTEDATRG